MTQTRRKPRAYLSVDLDFFASANFYNGRQGVPDFHRLFRGLDVPIVVSHEEILPHLDGQDIEVLINIDAHDDLCAHPVDLSDGSWVEHALLPNTIQYVWIHPFDNREDALSEGRCDWSTPPPYGRSMPFGRWRYRSYSIRTASSHEKLFKLLGAYDIVAASLALSPPYLMCDYELVSQLIYYLNLGWSPQDLEELPTFSDYVDVVTHLRSREEYPSCDTENPLHPNPTQTKPLLPFERPWVTLEHLLGDTFVSYVKTSLLSSETRVS